MLISYFKEELKKTYYNLTETELKESEYGQLIKLSQIFLEIAELIKYEKVSKQNNSDNDYKENIRIINNLKQFNIVEKIFKLFLSLGMKIENASDDNEL